MLLLPAKSADPPQNSGNTLEIAAIVLPEAALVDTSFPASNLGKSILQLFGNSRFRSRAMSSADLGLELNQESNFRFHSF